MPRSGLYSDALGIQAASTHSNPKLKIVVTGANGLRGALLQRAGASEVVVMDELIAGALVDRLGKGGQV